MPSDGTSTQMIASEGDLVDKVSGTFLPFGADAIHRKAPVGAHRSPSDSCALLGVATSDGHLALFDSTPAKDSE